MTITGPLKLNVQLLRGSKPAIGPGKALVLEAVQSAGSISAAGRALGMSYRRIWLLIDALNQDWREPVVDTQPGGSKSHGARLTPFGRDLLHRYRAMERAMLSAADGEDLSWLKGAMKPGS